MRDAGLSNVRVPASTDPKTDLAAPDSSLSEESVPIDHEAVKGSVPRFSPVWQRLSFSTILLVTLIWVPVLGQAATAERLGARDESLPPRHAGTVVTEVRRTPPCPVTWSIKIRTCHRTTAALHFPRPRSFDPNDDEASDGRDEDDDDDWDDPVFDDNSNEPVIDWLPDTFCFLTLLKVASTSARPGISSSPFLPPQRLRC